MGDPDLSRGRVLEHRGQRVSPLLGRDRVVGVAEDLQRPAAQHGGGVRRRVGHRAAEVDQPTVQRRAPAGRPWPRHRRPGRRRRRRPAPSWLVSNEVIAAGSSCSATTSSAPAARARSVLGPGRHTPTTRPAPRTLAAPIADCPTAPPAPSTSTVSPGWSRAFQVRHIHAATRRRAEGGDRGVVGSVGDRHHVVIAYDAPLGHPAVARAHAGVGGEPHPRADRDRAGLLDDTDALDAGDVGDAPAHRSTTCRRRTAGREVRRARRSPARACVPARPPGRDGRRPAGADPGCG